MIKYPQRIYNEEANFMKKRFRKLLSVSLAAAMTLCMIPAATTATCAETADSLSAPLVSTKNPNTYSSDGFIETVGVVCFADSADLPE